MSKYLRPDHPSYDCGQAWFMFAMKNHRGEGFCRVILVEAKNHAAVSFIERIVSDSIAVSPTCELLTVLRQCPDIGIRSNMADEVPFDDFACDIVDRAKVDRDPLALQAYKEATSAPSPAPAARKSPAPLPARKTPAPNGETYNLAIATLADLGFKRPQAESMLSKIGEVEGRTIEDVIRAALRACRSPAA